MRVHNKEEDKEDKEDKDKDKEETESESAQTSIETPGNWSCHRRSHIAKEIQQVSPQRVIIHKS